MSRWNWRWVELVRRCRNSSSLKARIWAVTMGKLLMGLVQAHIPGAGFESVEAGEEPGMVNEVGDQGLLVGADGMEAVEVVVAKGFEGGAVLSDDGVGFGEDAVFEGVPAGGGFAFGGAGAGRFACVEAIGLDLFVVDMMSPPG